MQRRIECRGDPRAMGLAQGASCREGVRARAEHLGLARRWSPWRGLRPLTSGRVLGRGTGREIIRHHPHLSERMQGLARGAGLPFETLMELFLQATRAGSPDGVLAAEAAVVLVPDADAGGPVVVRALPEGGLPGSDWIVRHSDPEVGFASLDVTLPWLASAVAGVNERGLAVAIAAGEPDSRSPGSDPSTVMSLVQECLQRFGDVRGCADWCGKRPTSGRATIVMAEASGRTLALEIAGCERSIVPGGRGLAVAGGGEALRSRLRSELQASHIGIEDLVRCHAAREDDPTVPFAAAVALQPGPRRLTLHRFTRGGGEGALRFELPQAG